MADQNAPGSDGQATPHQGSQAPTTPDAQAGVLQQKLDQTISQVNGLKSKNDELQKQVADLSGTAEAARTLRVEATVKGLLLDHADKLPSAALRTIREKMEGMQFADAEQAKTMFDALVSTAQTVTSIPPQGQTPPVATPPPTPPSVDNGGAGGSPAPTVDPSKLTAKQKMAAGYAKNASAGEGKYV